MGTIIDGRERLKRLIAKSNIRKLSDREMKELTTLIQWYKEEELEGYNGYREDLLEEELSYYLFPKKENGNKVISLDSYKEYKRILEDDGNE